MKEIYYQQKIPDYIVDVGKVLKDHKFSCYLVGGAVRDILMNRSPKDYDLATDAKPDDISRIFPVSITTNAKFGTILVVVKDELGENVDVEITTFRSEADYVDGRWPSSVEFTTDLYKDLGRRDFTINAMAIDVQSINDGVDNELIDVFGGEQDIHDRVIQAVGTPLERMKEDGLRAFKACRLASELNFQIANDTYSAIQESLDIAKQISMERIRDEFMKLLLNSPKPSVGIELLRRTGLLKLFIPELLEGVDVKQPEKYHTHDVYKHILATIDSAEDDIKLAALFHDIGKPRCAKDGHFYKHDVVSAAMTQSIMKRLKFSKAEIDRVSRLVRWHMFVYSDWRDGDYESNWTDAAVRRFVQRIGGEEYVDDLFRLRMADALGNPKTNFDPGEIHVLERRISEVRAQDMALTVEDLDIDGNDLKSQLGIPPGPKIGKLLHYLLDQVIEDPSLNDKHKLLKLVQDVI